MTAPSPLPRSFRPATALGSYAALLIAALVLPGVAQAQALQPFTPEDALNVRSFGIGAITDDGRWIAGTIATPRDRLNVDHMRYGDPTYVSPSLEELVLMDTESGEMTPILDGKVQTNALTWSPDGTTLAFLLYENDRQHLRLYDRASGEVRAVELSTDQEIASNSGLDWRPDGSGILLDLRSAGWREASRQAYLELTEGPVIVQRGSDPFLDWDRVRGMGSFAIPALVAIPSGDVRELLPEGRYGGMEQTADGRYLTTITQRPLKTVYEGNDGTEFGMLRIEVQSGDTARLIEPDTERISANWHPDGYQYAYADGGDVFLRSIEGDSAVRITPEERGQVSETDTAEIRYGVSRWSPDGQELLVTSQRGWHLMDVESREMALVREIDREDETGPRESIVAWAPDGSAIYLSTSERDRWERGLARYDMSEARISPDSARVQQLILNPNRYGGWRLTEDGDQILFTMSDGDHPTDLWISDPGLREPRRLTEMNPWLDDYALTRSELVEYLDVDGNKQFGILYYPTNYEPGTEYPLVAEIYEDFFENGFNANMNLLANQGWFGFRPSVELEEGFPGEGWLKGVTAGINTLIERGIVDERRLGVHGTSYGGYATNLLITQTNRFAAAINISGKVNIISFLGDSPKITTRNYRAAESGQDRIGATLWEQPQKYIQHSAIMFADRIETPLLLMTGEGDWNVPATNEREMYYALRRLGKEVEWVHYMNAGHGAGRSGTVSDFHDHWGRIFDWYSKHFEEALGEPRRAIGEDAGG